MLIASSWLGFQPERQRGPPSSLVSTLASFDIYDRMLVSEYYNGSCLAAHRGPYRYVYAGLLVYYLVGLGAPGWGRWRDDDAILSPYLGVPELYSSFCSSDVRKTSQIRVDDEVMKVKMW
jgi:hypothetical protein